MMRRKLFLKRVAIVALFPMLFIAACGDQQKGETASAKEKVQTFTCPMHPQIIKNEMGTCPICAMDLVPFEKNSADKAIKLDATRQALANITTIIIGENSLTSLKQLNGRLVVNPEQSSYISSRVAGRIEQLYVRETGVKVQKGQPLYRLYAEQLATLQQEYLMAVAQEQQFQGSAIEKQIVAAAKQKLMLYGQSEKAIQQLRESKKKDPFITFYAPESGLVAELAVTSGQYVNEGSPILRLEAYRQLWVEADVYPREAAGIKIGQKVKVVISGWEDRPQEMTIDFMSPALQSGTQLTQIRGSISNLDNQWQPGLQANVFLPAGEPGKVLSLPVDAVIRDGKGTHVWLKTSKDSYEPRLVKIGQENHDQVEIISGLKNGDQVVATGAYLLYSEYILKKGKNPIDGLK